MYRKPEIKTQVTVLVREMRAAGLPVKRQQALEMVAKMHGFRDWNTMSGVLDNEENREAVQETSRTIPHFDPSRQIMLTWHIEDVQSVRPDLTDDEAFDLLWQVKQKHDAELGVNWETLRTVASWDYGNRIVPCKLSVKLASGELRSVAATVNLTEGGQVLVDGFHVSTLNPEGRGTLTFDALPSEVFVVRKGRLAWKVEDGVDEFDEELEEMCAEAESDGSPDTSFSDQLIRDIVADLDAAGVLTSIRQ